MKLSILIPSIESRKFQLDFLVTTLYVQLGKIKQAKTPFRLDGCLIKIIEFDEAEIIIAIDDKQISTGAKRQLLLNLASGDYVMFIDDDDMVYDYYISEMLEAAKSDCDCFAINGIMTTDGQKEIKWRISKNYPNVTVVEAGHPVYLRTTNHITGVKRKIAKQGGFPDKSNAEDKAYTESIIGYLNTEYTIHPPMYHYQYESTNKQYS